MSDDYTTRVQAARQARIAELKAFGIAAVPGGTLGVIEVGAAAADKVLAALRRLKRLQEAVKK